MWKNDQERYALIGHPVGHSLSLMIHSRILEILDIEAEYDVLDVSPESFDDEVPKILERYDGLNVTIPYKERIISYLDSLSSAADRYGAVNTIFQNVGFNTDSSGFLANGFQYRGKKVLILGTGGVAKTMLHSVARDGAKEIVLVSRSWQKAQEVIQKLHPMYPEIALAAMNYEDLYTSDNSFNFILNGTPIGMWPNIGLLPLDESCYIRLLEHPEMEAVFDSIYNPLATRFVLFARSRDIRAVSGLKMLFYQAFESERIWHPMLERRFTEDIVLSRLAKVQMELPRQLLKHFPLRIVICGFMAAGKSTTAAVLADRLGKDVPCIDLDSYIEQLEKMPTHTIFETKGEAYFRNVERTCLTNLLQEEGSMIIAVGGGTVIQDGVGELIHLHTCQIVFLDVGLETALLRAGDRKSRPLLQQEDEQIRTLYGERRKTYLQLADLVVSGDAEASERAETILRAYEL